MARRPVRVSLDEALWAAVEAAARARRIAPHLFVEEVLTAALGPSEALVRLTELARSAGIDGIVCSGEEVGAAHRVWRDGFFVVPGVRPADGHAGDQKRVVTPRAALDAGASILVVGRPITGAADPRAVAQAIVADLA